MNNKILGFKDCQTLTGYKPVNKVIDVLRENGIKFIRTKDGVTTTIDAINAGMGIDKQTEKREITL